jgi:hypothetical protein
MTDKPEDLMDEPEMEKTVSDDEIRQAIAKHKKVMESLGCKFGWIEDVEGRR